MYFLIGYNDTTGEIVGMHATTILDELPQVAAESNYPAGMIIESEEFPIVQGKVVRNGVLEDRVRDLTDVRREGKRKLLRKVAAARTPYVTKTRGQGLIHLKKEQEARRFLALGTIPNDLTDFPLLEAEVGVSAGSLHEVAQLWIDKARETDAALARIERSRMDAKAAIAKAGSEQEVENILARFENGA